MNLVNKPLAVLFLFLLIQHRGLANTGFSSPKDSVLYQETAVVNGVKYTAANVLLKPGEAYKFYLKDANGKIIYTKDQALSSFKFSDFNKDGYKDLILELSGVDSGVQDLLLYNPATKSFILAGNCSNAERIPNAAYYYTYEDCCMGRNWSSQLFYIRNLKIVDVALIKYEDGYGLSFFKLRDKKKVFIKKRNVRINGCTPVSTGKHIDFEWGKYWEKHWQAYVK